MAQDGEFPWHAESRLREPTYLDEKPTPAHDDVPRPSKGHEQHEVHPPHKPHSLPHIPVPFVKHGGAKRVSIVQPAAPEPSTKQHIPREGAMHVPVRTIPPWVRDAEESDLEDLEELPSALVAHHNHAPSNQRLLLGARHHKTARPPPERTSQWLSFAAPSAYPRENFDSEIVDEKWLEENDADYSKPWLAGRYHGKEDGNGEDAYHAFKKRRRVWYKRVQFIVLRNPFVPLGFRLVIIAFALAALALGTAIYHETNKIVHCIEEASNSRTQYCQRLIGTKSINYYHDPSGLMAVIVDAIAVVYSIYITYDEYFSKPLGLRSTRNKVRLILLDLFFIVFQSANLSLSFSSLNVDEGACEVGNSSTTDVRFASVCEKQQALSSVLLVSLVAWLLTFSVSVLRLVERINIR